MAGTQGRLLEEEGFAGMGCSGEHGITGATHVSVSMRETGNLGLLSYIHITLRCQGHSLHREEITAPPE